MKPQLIKVFRDEVNSFNARKETKPNSNNYWHYHPEVELIYFQTGHGTQFIGDNIGSFNEGDIVLVGPNLPHFWEFDEKYLMKPERSSVDITVIHFDQYFLGSTFLDLPEMKEMKRLLEEARRGIQIQEARETEIANLIEELATAQGTRKILLLIEVLSKIADTKERNSIASVGFNHNFQESEKDRINAIHNYSIQNFKKKISLAEIADVAGMSTNSFCKYFRLKTKKTYTEFINEIRVSHACKLLIEGKVSVKETAYQSGFCNFSSFHKFFKQQTGKSPLAYRRSFNLRGKGV